MPRGMPFQARSAVALSEFKPLPPPQPCASSRLRVATLQPVAPGVEPAHFRGLLRRPASHTKQPIRAAERRHGHAAPSPKHAVQTPKHAALSPKHAGHSRQRASPPVAAQPATHRLHWSSEQASTARQSVRARRALAHRGMTCAPKARPGACNLQCAAALAWRGTKPSATCQQAWHVAEGAAAGVLGGRAPLKQRACGKVPTQLARGSKSRQRKGGVHLISHAAPSQRGGLLCHDIGL